MYEHRRTRKTAGIWLWLPVLLMAATAWARPQAAKRADVEAVVVTKLMDFVHWPGENGGPLRTRELTVLGDTPLLPRLVYLARRREGPGRRLRVRHARRVSEVGDTDAVFIAPDQSPILRHVLEVVARPGVLTLGNTPGYGTRGVAINLYRESRKVRFSVNLSALRRGGITASHHLITLARVVER